MTELEAFKAELNFFLRKSRDAMHDAAKKTSLETKQGRDDALEKIHTALAFANLVSMIEAGAFDPKRGAA